MALREAYTPERQLRITLDGLVKRTLRSYPFKGPHDTLPPIAKAQENVGDTAKEIKGTTEEIKGNLQSLGRDMAGALEPYFEKHIAAPILKLNTDLGQRQTETSGPWSTSFGRLSESSVRSVWSSVHGKWKPPRSRQRENAAIPYVRPPDPVGFSLPLPDGLDHPHLGTRSYPPASKLAHHARHAPQHLRENSFFSHRRWVPAALDPRTPPTPFPGHPTPFPCALAKIHLSFQYVPRGAS